ncbi:MAG: NAD-dependent epimerase/dehydratase family protein, partial [Nitrospiraceae bacterium]|nr:NAD-dependent epimerase/dehydratase family protein [Nitrospiraceae bacterium]
LEITFGYLKVKMLDGVREVETRIMYPPRPGSVYHVTKCQDALLFQYYAENDLLRITDLHQGIVWGTNTPQTARDERLINRFDYDGDYGTVLNRFLMQAAIGHPLTVHGTGGQTRAFIHIRDTVRCIELAISNPPDKREGVKIINQMTETHRVRDLAKMVSGLTGAAIAYLENPRNEAAENDLSVENKCLLDLGLDPTTLKKGLMEEVIWIAKKYAGRCDASKIICTSRWRKEAVEDAISARAQYIPEEKQRYA